MGKNHRSPPALPPGAAFLPAEMAAMERARASASASTPAVVREALLGQPITVGEVTLPVIMLGHTLLLQQIDSPFVKAQSSDPTEAQIAETLFILNTPAVEVRRLLQQGREVFSEAVLEFATNKVPLASLRAIGVALGAQLRAAQSTVIGGSSSFDSPASSGEGTGTENVAKKNGVKAVPLTCAGERADSNRAARPPSPTG